MRHDDPHRWLFSYNGTKWFIPYLYYSCPRLIHLNSLYSTQKVSTLHELHSPCVWALKMKTGKRCTRGPPSSDITVLFQASCARRWVTVKHHRFIACYSLKSLLRQANKQMHTTDLKLDLVTVPSLHEINLVHLPMRRYSGRSPLNLFLRFLFSSKMFCIYSHSVAAALDLKYNRHFGCWIQHLCIWMPFIMVWMKDWITVIQVIQTQVQSSLLRNCDLRFVVDSPKMSNILKA